MQLLEFEKKSYRVPTDFLQKNQSIFQGNFETLYQWNHAKISVFRATARVL